MPLTSTKSQPQSATLAAMRAVVSGLRLSMSADAWHDGEPNMYVMTSSWKHCMSMH